MGELLTYMLQSSILLTALYLAYKWLMANEKVYAFNRVLLLTIYTVAFLLPGFALTRNIVGMFSTNRHAAIEADIDMPLPIIATASTEENSSIWPLIAISIYLVGVMALCIITATGYMRLAKIVRTGEHIKLRNGSILVLTEGEDTAPFSWMRYVVMSRKDYAECGAMVLTHELEHLRQQHWIDMLLAQIVIILQWFNPTAWLMRDELRSIHEYQADAAVLTSGINARQYQLLLIKKAVGKSFPALANSLNHSKLKKRITMMQKSKSRKSRRMLALALVPAAIAAVAVLNLPMVANALNAVANTKMPFAESDGKVTNSMDVSNEFEAEIPVEEVAQVEISMENPEATHTASSLKGRVSNIKINKSASSSDQQPKFIFKVNGKELQPDAEGNIDYHGMKFNVNILNSLSPEQIKSMTVNREASTVTIELMDPEEVPAKVMAKLPIYPGGDKALLNYVCENVKYPDGAPTDGKTYRVVTQFEISKTGKVGSAKILRSQGELFDAEALRVISLLPDFEPGENENGEKIATTYTLPISFKAVGDDEKAE